VSCVSILIPHQSGENLISEPVPVPVRFIWFVYSMFTPKREETSGEGGESAPEDKRQGRTSTVPSRPQLTEQTLL
jgi:hypothetical protein